MKTQENGRERDSGGQSEERQAASGVNGVQAMTANVRHGSSQTQPHTKHQSAKSTKTAEKEAAIEFLLPSFLRLLAIPVPMMQLHFYNKQQSVRRKKETGSRRSRKSKVNTDYLLPRSDHRPRTQSKGDSGMIV